MERNIDDIKKRVMDQVEKEKQERLERIKEYWNTLEPFKDPYDIPEIPRAEPEEYKNFYVPKLIGAGAIPKNQLIDGQYYIGNHRNCTVARWNAEKNEFEYNRHKWGQVFIDTCNHFEDDDGFALFVPIGIGTEEKFIKNNYR